MAQHKEKTILLLCTGNHLAARCAEALFGSVAGKMGLPWVACCKTLAVDAGPKAAGRASPAVSGALGAMGLRFSEELTRTAAPLAVEDLEKADRIVAMNRLEHLPLLQERFPAWADKVEYWDIDDSPEGLRGIEHEVMDLAARLIRGGERQKAPPKELCPKCQQSIDACKCPAKKDIPRNVTVRVGRETKGRRGKGVTTVSDLPLDEKGVAELAARLKQRLGTGGTIKDGRIEIQGDQRDRIVQELEGMGYCVKRAGG